MDKNSANTSRYRLLRRIIEVFETPMIILGFIWLVLLIIELVYSLNPVLEAIGFIIWGIFVVDFLIKFFIAPKKVWFLKRNILTIISLVVPAFRIVRVFRVLRLLRFSRSLRLVKVFGSLNRGIRVLGNTMKKRAVGYVVAMTVLVLFVGAAGMFAFERDEGLKDYSSALWWTAMLLTTMGSEYWPKSTEGRVLCFVLSLYAFAMFGYVTATISTFFIGKDVEDEKEKSHDLNNQELLQAIRELMEKKSQS